MMLPDHYPIFRVPLQTPLSLRIDEELPIHPIVHEIREFRYECRDRDGMYHYYEQAPR